ncbi:DUF2059 domain-containing protein [Rubripirellula reticaptiva]|uniref:DUF2059 domain-containing protein n=1 Tax=Rubripirellula reticaptiva TaxID=2528013 RepID=A0A5C6EJR0_9BACT|nr:DUF2059 domain-containing protein [Rubripirellula reticaptiva]TWU47871.1 hypothetical protein Poly59_47130 [Rubripirellula reticaptiva]
MKTRLKLLWGRVDRLATNLKRLETRKKKRILDALGLATILVLAWGLYRVSRQDSQSRELALAKSIAAGTTGADLEAKASEVILRLEENYQPAGEDELAMDIIEKKAKLQPEIGKKMPDASMHYSATDDSELQPASVENDKTLSELVSIKSMAEKTADPLESVEPSPGSPRSDVETLLDLLQSDEAAKQTIQRMLEQNVRQSPEMSPYGELIREFFEKYFAYDVLKDEIVELYDNSFTDEEIQQMIAFYSTPVGQKAVRLLPALAIASGELGVKPAEANIKDLHRAIEKRETQLRAAGINEIAPQP